MERVVMILTNFFRPDLRVLKEARYIVQLGYEVEILCWDRENKLINNKSVEFEKNIFVKRFYPKAKPGTGFKQIIPYFRFIKNCKNHLRNANYKYLHCHDLDGIIAGVLISKNKEKIFDMHEFYEGKHKNFIIRKAIRIIVYILQFISKYIIYINKEQIKHINKKRKKKYIYLPNYPSYNKKNILKKTNDGKLRISYIGVVRQYKEIEMLFESTKNFNNIEVNVWGSGVDLNRIKEIEGNYPNVIIHGEYNPLDTEWIYSNTDISYVIYPMKNKQNIIGIPVKFYETIFFSTPMIINKEKIISKFVSDKNIGYLLYNNDVNDLKKIVSQIINDKKDYLVKIKNIENFSSKFIWANVVVNLNRIYRRIY